MYRRLFILTVIIVAALSALAMLGYHAVNRWAEGLEWKRVGEFADVAEQIRQDVKRKLDAFIQKEQNRSYTEYQYYYVPANITNVSNISQQQMPLLRSPLSGSMEHGLGYGHFQIGPGNTIVTANDDIELREGVNFNNADISAQNKLNRWNIKNSLLPVLQRKTRLTRLGVTGLHEAKKASPHKVRKVAARSNRRRRAEIFAKAANRRSMNLPIESLQKKAQSTQMFRQSRAQVESNISNNAIPDSRQLEINSRRSREKSSVAARASENMKIPAESMKRRNQKSEDSKDKRYEALLPAKTAVESFRVPDKSQTIGTDSTSALLFFKGDNGRLYGLDSALVAGGNTQDETVVVRVEPFVPVVVPDSSSDKSIFGGQVYLLRHVQIGERHFRQGFMLNEDKLITEVKESAQRLMRKGMCFELPQLNHNTNREDSAYTAVFDFGFGDLTLAFNETNPGWIARQINQLKSWYLSIVIVVLMAVSLGLLSLWRYARAQIKLAEKKDDFISAVSHELRTPLTSLRMYSEMLEKNWIKSEDKLVEYYRSMRQESERLSRLIENVLDFSRIQKGRKTYTFSLGDLNQCVLDVVEMIKPYAAQNGFTVKTELAPAMQMTFDKDSVKQIIVNLLDNAIKYARNAADKTVIVRTRRDTQYVLIEVEDRGPGVPRRQQKKVFEEFYRLGSETTRETTGTGLGLALVKKFAQAHNGFVEILSAKPAGAIFRVGLAVQT